METSKESIRAVFDSFDKDKSGFIDFNEIVSVAKELGQEISTNDVKKVVLLRSTPVKAVFLDFQRHRYK